MRGEPAIPDYDAVLVGVSNKGNIGATARVMANFGASRLWLVGEDVPELDDEVYARAMHAGHILKKAERVTSLEDVECDILAATSSTLSGKEENFLRYALTPREFSSRFARLDGRVGVVFGRESSGLTLDEVRLCDVQVTIPTSPEYPTLNVSHAASVIFYETFLASPREGTDRTKRRSGMVMASGDERRRLAREFDLMMDLIRYPSHKTETTKLLFRRMLSRAAPTRWEYHTLMGVFKRMREARRR